jgi:regulator of protease activity HflC (stomatin/prohibitin superfamily)
VGEVAVRLSATVLSYALLSVLLLIIAFRSVRFVKKSERAVLFRLGKFVSVHTGPVVILVPYIDRLVRIRVQQIEGAEGMSEGELVRRIAKIYES